MTVVTYRGDVEELQGQQFDVPATVMSAGQAGAWIESTWREEQARRTAAAEAERRQQELLAARLDEQRRVAGDAAAEADAIQTRSELEAGLRDELTDLSQSVMAAGGAIVGKAELIEAQTRDWEARHEAMVATSEERLATVEERELQMLAKVELAVEQADLGEQQREERFAEAQAELRQQILSQVGPQGVAGDRGMAGAGFAYVDTDPTRIDPGSLGKRNFGRPVVPGDMLLQRTPDSLKVWRSPEGKSWQQIDEIVNKQELVSQPLSISDQSTKVFPTVTTMGGGGGSGLADPIVVAGVARNTPVIVADSSRWQAGGFDTFRSGELFLEITPFDGSLGGRTSFLVASFVVQAGLPDPFRFTQSAALGDLLNGNPPAADVVLTGSVQAPSVPAGLGVTVAPTAKNATVLSVSINGAGAGATRYLLRGSIVWTADPATATQASNLPPTKLPAWSLI